MLTITSRNPATGELIGELQQTSQNDLPKLFEKARTAQKTWATLSVENRARYLLQLREVLLNHVDSLSDLIARENGKPRFEAMANELLPSVDMLTYFAKRAPKLLRDRKIPLALMKHRKSYLNYWPLGVVAVISPWNYPFLLPFAEIFMALVAGNAVIFKPSEITPFTGLRIQELCREAGFPVDLLQTVTGGGALGAAIIEQKPAKIFFTGSVATGKKVMTAAAAHLIPVNLELGGKDAMIVLRDADLDFASSAALWGGFSNSGQMCASVERLIVHESIKQALLDLLAKKMSLLRKDPAQPAQTDLGAITFEKQKEVYERHLNEAREKGATIMGGQFSSNRTYLEPTLVTGDEIIEHLAVFNEETFGPVVAVTTFCSVEEAIRKANASRYGLLASIITKNIPLGEQIAKNLEVGTVMINEVAYTAGLGETPWGGVKESGFGRTHSDLGMYEFVNVRHIHKPLSASLVFKSAWWFPYTHFQFNTFRKMFELYRNHWGDKLRAFPHFLWNFVQMVKGEKRL